jgi:hypothetical protein
MEKSEAAGVLWRLVRERAQKSPRVVTIAQVEPDTWAVRADFDDGRRDYRYASGGPLEEVPGGFACWPPSVGVTREEPAIVHEMWPRQPVEK